MAHPPVNQRVAPTIHFITIADSVVVAITVQRIGTDGTFLLRGQIVTICFPITHVAQTIRVKVGSVGIALVKAVVFCIGRAVVIVVCRRCECPWKQHRDMTRHPAVVAGKRCGHRHSTLAYR